MAQSMMYIVYAWLVGSAVVHLILAFAVWNNASERERDKKPLMYMGSGGWGLATLVGGLLGVLVYWLVHHSALRKLYTKEEENAARKG